MARNKEKSDRKGGWRQSEEIEGIWSGRVRVESWKGSATGKGEERFGSLIVSLWVGIVSLCAGRSEVT